MWVSEKWNCDLEVISGQRPQAEAQRLHLILGKEGQERDWGSGLRPRDMSRASLFSNPQPPPPALVSDLSQLALGLLPHLRCPEQAWPHQRGLSGCHVGPALTRACTSSEGVSHPVAADAKPDAAGGIGTVDPTGGRFQAPAVPFLGNVDVVGWEPLNIW